MTMCSESRFRLLPGCRVLMVFMALFFMAGPLLTADLNGKDEPVFALKASRILDGAGHTLKEGYVVIQGSKILALGPTIQAPGGCRVIDLKDAVICPGFIDACSAMGVRPKDNSEPVSAVEPDLKAADLFTPGHDDFRHALACGITSVLIVPSSENVIGGCAVAVKTFGSDTATRILNEEGPLAMTVASSCFKPDRYPTSRIGALDLLETTLTDKAALQAHPVLAQLRQGRKTGFFVANEHYDILSALALAEKYNLKLTLVGAARLDRVLDRLGTGKTPVIFGPFDFNSSERQLRLPAAAAKAGLPIAFMSGAPARDPMSLRITAALAQREGLDRDIALRALTSQAAALAGTSHRVGTLAPGMDADLAVFSGHPLDLDARLLRVYVDGNLAFEGQAKNACCGENQ
jgi:imidazolonepropionase-like amidohydrolase